MSGNLNSDPYVYTQIQPRRLGRKRPFPKRTIPSPIAHPSSKAKKVGKAICSGIAIFLDQLRWRPRLCSASKCNERATERRDKTELKAFFVIVDRGPFLSISLSASGGGGARAAAGQDGFSTYRVHPSIELEV